MAIEFSEWPLGNDGELSNGGTASSSGGRARPTAALPTLVISSDPAPVTATSATGDHDRHSRARPTATAVASTGMPILPPRSVKAVTAVFSAGERSADRGVEHGLVEPGHAVALDHALVDLGGAAGHQPGDDQARRPP